ncbi:uncharacterized protein LOC119769228 [Culex quinquefasciatus]|uniref:uncharacterized protein LOC119769228 n=1 Tax=Culex quinquefasciatus TaxID=7176 RepID=UPI0018E3E419|nr:uncharacterized protein LOC119769228 [Culex quinquefasciatus]
MQSGKTTSMSSRIIKSESDAHSPGQPPISSPMSISALTARLMDDCDGGSMQLGSLEVDPAWPYADEDLESPICHSSCGKLLTSVVRPQRQLVPAYRKYSESVQEPNRARLRHRPSPRTTAGYYNSSFDDPILPGS